MQYRPINSCFLVEVDNLQCFFMLAPFSVSGGPTVGKKNSPESRKNSALSKDMKCLNIV